MTDLQMDHLIQLLMIFIIFIGLPVIICAIVEPFLKDEDDD